MEEDDSSQERKTMPRAPAAELVGFRPVSAGHGEAAFEMVADRRHHNPMGTVHGGILMTLADSAMGFAFASTLLPGESFTTLEAKISYLRPVFEGHVAAVARVVHRGKTVGLVECEVTNGDGKLVAKTSSTCQVLRGEAVKGRALFGEKNEGPSADHGGPSETS